MQLPFAKYEGLGNDFIIVDAAAFAGFGPADAAQLCNRHLGIGADGVLLVDTSGTHPAMKVVNADGSVPEMCGNGIRCVALHLLRQGQSAELVIDTGAGPHPCNVTRSGSGARVEVGMSAGILTPGRVPVVADAALIDTPVQVAGQTLRLTALSMGNPHAVTFDDVGDGRISLGPLLGCDARFPEGVNVGFARLLGPQQIELAVFERGAGWTRACGTGACAAAIAAVETGRAQRHLPIEVQLPGGVLTIVVGDPDQPVSMTGPARHVFDGVLQLD
jgi:diaminopimelate epimerase